MGVADVAQLVQRLDEIVAEQRRMREAMEALKRERDEYRALYQDMLVRCRELERGLLGAKTERLAPDE